MSSRRSISFLLILGSVINLVVVFLLSRRSVPLPPAEYTYQGHDYPETLPLPYDDLDEVLLTVEESDRYPLLGHPSDPQWSALAPKSGGYVRLGPENRLFLVSMFHQMHCLRFFNWAFDPKFEGIYKIFATEGHSAHCLNYLRQVILCSPDLTLEKGDFQKRDFAVERVGATHTCRNWGPVYEIADQNWDVWQNLTHSNSSQHV